MAENKKKTICCGSLRELALEERNLPPINIGKLAKAIEKADPGGEKALRLYEKYSEKKSLSNIR